MPAANRPGLSQYLFRLEKIFRSEKKYFSESIFCSLFRLWAFCFISFFFVFRSVFLSALKETKRRDQSPAHTDTPPPFVCPGMSVLFVSRDKQLCQIGCATTARCGYRTVVAPPYIPPCFLPGIVLRGAPAAHAPPPWACRPTVV